MITKKFIIDTTFSEYNTFLKAHNMSASIPLRNVVVKKMSPFGAAVSDGSIRINNAYVGTELYDELLDTIRHEISHLIVGFAEGHGRKWQKCCKLIGCNPEASTSISDKTFLKNNYNYALFAIFADNGEVKMVKHYKRMTTKYTSAKPNSYSIKGRGIERFYFEEISIIDKV